MTEPADPSIPDDGLTLTVDEARGLAHRLVEMHLHDVDEWLDWGDLPLLTLVSFERVVDNVKALAEIARHDANAYDDRWGIDGRNLWENTQ